MTGEKGPLAALSFGRLRSTWRCHASLAFLLRLAIEPFSPVMGKRLAAKLEDAGSHEE